MAQASLSLGFLDLSTVILRLYRQRKSWKIPTLPFGYLSPVVYYPMKSACSNCLQTSPFRRRSLISPAASGPAQPYDMFSYLKIVTIRWVSFRWYRNTLFGGFYPVTADTLNITPRHQRVRQNFKTSEETIVELQTRQHWVPNVWWKGSPEQENSE